MRHPERKFKKVWKGWPDFLDIDRPTVVHSYKEAKIICKKLNIKTLKEWEINYKKGKLKGFNYTPSRYKEWEGALKFFNKTPTTDSKK